MASVLEFIIQVLIYIITSLPLYFAVKFLGGKTTLLKTAVIVLISGFLLSLIESYFDTFATIIAFIALLWIYKSFFIVGWLRALLIWLVHGLILIVLRLLATLLGIAAITGFVVF